jgi:hypothetical protein
MSKAKKAAYAEKQKAASTQASSRELTPLGGDTASKAKTAKKSHTRKQSRGK